ncbi:hypothetical protein [Skermanella stibiiresistens]|uniref:hypothetical protein n=1 Tax=Skermanella stibiiresistens TaxID=913326 RepID=UPI001B3B58E8|nr:hypothetical protein [Skermanella stibiiresistens]
MAQTAIPIPGYARFVQLEAVLNIHELVQESSIIRNLGKSSDAFNEWCLRSLDQATFLSDGTAIFQESCELRNEILYWPGPIFRLYAFVLVELISEMDQREMIHPEMSVLAEACHEQLGIAHGMMFDQDYFELVRDTLRDELERIDCTTNYKDNLYHDVFDAIYAFLYASNEQSVEPDGVIWGFSNFWAVWESMCLTELVETTSINHLLCVDTSFINFGHSTDLCFSIRGSNEEKWINLRPDAVVESTALLNIRLKTNAWDDFGYKATYTLSLPISGVSMKVKLASLDHQKGDFHSSHSSNSLVEKGLAVVIDDKDRYGQKYIAINLRYPFPDDIVSHITLDDDEIDNMPQNDRIYLFKVLIRLNSLSVQYVLDGTKGSLDFPKWLEKNAGRSEFLEKCIFREYTDQSLRILAKDFFDIIEKHRVDWAAARHALVPALTIIDIKYVNEHQMLDSKAETWVFEKDLRKQFVYEKILQSRYPRHRIRSELWLPTKRESGILVESYPSVYSHIHLRLKNFRDTMNVYIHR